MSANPAIDAQARLHHQLFLGVQLYVATREDPSVIFDWMFALFRRQHEEKFLASFEKLGLTHEPPAIACAKYHVLSNGVGGVAVEYMAETDTKAWVRFRYPRWMYAGPAICGIPVEASRGFLHGWYAQNGVSLNNPRLGFVCVSEDMTGQFGLCGYFKEYDRPLSDAERLVFAPNERPPDFDPDAQPEPPVSQWNPERLERANRNYALEYVRNGYWALCQVLGAERAQMHYKNAARLMGLQSYPDIAQRLAIGEGGVRASAALFVKAMSGLGDNCTLIQVSDSHARIQHAGLRIIRDFEPSLANGLLDCWCELWRGVVQSQRVFMDVSWTYTGTLLNWDIRLA